MPPKLVTLPHQHIMSIGKFDLSSGPEVFTKEDLAAVIESLDDPAVKKPRLKLGHGKPRPGEPAFGVFDNFSLENNGQDLYADLVGVPDWLAAIMPTAYPNRSIEGSRDRQTATGRTHRVVVDRVALLGVELPGISTLEDLKKIWDNAPIPPEEAASVAPAILASYRGDKPIQAQVEVDDVRSAFYSDFATGTRAGWWMKSIHVDPMEVICEDESAGQLYRVPYTASGDGNVVFGDPVAVVMRYEDQATSTPMAAARAVYATAAESRPNQEDQVDPKELRKLLGLPENATDEELKARQDALARPDIQKLLGESQPAPAPAPPSPAPAPTPSPTPPAPGGAGVPSTPAPAAPAPPAADGVVQIAASALEEIKAEAKLGRQAREHQIKASRDAEINQAIGKGKIPRARFDHWRKLMDSDPEGTSAILASLAENVVPIQEVGVGGGDGDPANLAAAQGEPYDDTWLTPAERQRRDAARKGELVPQRIMMEA